MRREAVIHASSHGVGLGVVSMHGRHIADFVDSAVGAIFVWPLRSNVVVSLRGAVTVPLLSLAVGLAVGLAMRLVVALGLRKYAHGSVVFRLGRRDGFVWGAFRGRKWFVVVGGPVASGNKQNQSDEHKTHKQSVRHYSNRGNIKYTLRKVDNPSE